MVNAITQTAGATAAVTGIFADNLETCHVESLTASTSGTVAALSSYREATGCTVRSVTNSGSSGATGFSPADNGQTLNCTGDTAGTRGVQGGANCVVRNCAIHLNGTGNGIDMPGTSPVVEGNTVSGCAIGINVSGASGLVVKNRVTLCTNNIVVSATTQTGPVVTATGTISSTNPWANMTD
jgi:hypothetical protein